MSLNTQSLNTRGQPRYQTSAQEGWRRERRLGGVAGDECWVIYDSRKSENEGLQDGSETCCDVWFRDDVTHKKQLQFYYLKSNATEEFKHNYLHS